MGLAKGLELGSVVDSLWGRCHRRLLLRGRQEAQRQGEETVEGSRGHTGAVRGFEGEGTPGHGACGRQGLHSPLESLGGAEHCPHLRLQLLTARAVRVDFSCFKHYVCANLLQQLRETHTWSEVRPQWRRVHGGVQEPGGGGDGARRRGLGTGAGPGGTHSAQV